MFSRTACTASSARSRSAGLATLGVDGWGSGTTSMARSFPGSSTCFAALKMSKRSRKTGGRFVEDPGNLRATSSIRFAASRCLGSVLSSGCTRCERKTQAPVGVAVGIPAMQEALPAAVRSRGHHRPVLEQGFVELPREHAADAIGDPPPHADDDGHAVADQLDAHGSRDLARRLLARVAGIEHDDLRRRVRAADEVGELLGGER